jgi:type I restriction enzyme S subunit
MNKNFKFKEVVIDKKGFLRGPFGGDLKKEIFVPKDKSTYKVYEQGVVLNSDKNIGRYHISEVDYLAKLHKFSVQDKDFLISCSGVNMGAIYQLKEPFDRGIINQALLRVRLNNEIIDDNYFFYLFKELICKRITTGSGDSTIPNFPALEVIKNIEFELPQISIQEKIGKLLYDIDSKIELNNRINTELEAMAKTLYDYWFVQFDFLDANGKPYKTSGGKMVWNDELKREIPVNWEVKKIKNIAETGSGGTPLKSKKEYFENGLIPWINSGEVNASFIISSRKFITQKGLDNSSAKLFKRGTILMAMYGATAGQVSLIDLEASTNQAVCGILPNDMRMIPYLKYGLHQLYDYLINLSSGSARDNLSQDKIKELSFVIPEDNLIEQFYKISNSHFEMILKNLKENQELASLRDWLLPMLMNGQVSVGDFEEHLGMVAEPNVEYKKS